MGIIIQYFKQDGKQAQSEMIVFFSWKGEHMYYYKVGFF